MRSPFSPTPEELAEAQAAALAALEDSGQYQQGETVMKCLETGGYRVEHGIGRRPPLNHETPDVQEAVWRFLYWRQRRCTSCGQPGCARDLVGKKPFIVEPLPPSWNLP